MDVYGNVLSTYDQTFVYNYVYKTHVPANHIDVVDYNDKCGTIHDIDVYYDNTDQYTCGLVQFKKDTKLVWVQAETLFQSKFHRSDNMRQLLRHLKKQANKENRVSFEPIYKTVTYEYTYKNNPSEYHEVVNLSGDRRNNRAWGLAHTTDGFFEDATHDNMKWQQTVNHLSEKLLRDASEFVEHYATTVYTDMIFDCDDYRGLVQSTGFTSTPNYVAPQRMSIPSLRGLQTDTTNSVQIIKGNKPNNVRQC